MNVDEKKTQTEGFGNVNSNANFVVYGGQKQNTNLKNGNKEVLGKVYDNQDNLDYENTVLNQNKDLVYYYNDVIDQSKINETSYDIEHGIDLIDYSEITSGMDKCKKNCNGNCVVYGYDGVATCFPATYTKQPYDLGSLIKNPVFVLGITDNN